MKCYFIFLILFLLSFFVAVSAVLDHPLCYINCSIQCKHRTSNAKMRRLWLRLWLLPWPVPRPLCVTCCCCCCWVQHTQTIVECGDTYAVGVNYNNSELQPFFCSLLLSLAWVVSASLSFSPSLARVALAIKANQLTKSPAPPPLSQRPRCAKIAKKKWPT